MANTTQKQDQSLLGLPALSNDGTSDLVPYGAGQKPTNREEERVLELFHKHELIIGLTAAKARFGMNAQAAIQQHASDIFGPTISHMIQNKEEARGTEAEPYVAEFTLRQIQMYARHMLGTLEVAGTRIGEEVHRSLSLPPEQKGFWARVLGQ